jgi:predicted NUDIX family NTP pyrophosphohydrolase
VPKLSAGILLYRWRDDNSVEVLLVHPGGPFWANKDAHSWSVPKGEHNVDEDAEQAAVREFAEELGRPPPTGHRLDLGEIRQSGGKRVRVWAIQAEDFSTADLVSNRFEIEWPPRSGTLQSFPEVDRAEWLHPELARERLVRGQAEFLDRLLDQIHRQP